MGFPIDQFVDASINKGFLCSICHNVLQIATMAEPCEHLFCQQCLEKYLETEETCPVDQSPINEGRRPGRVYLDMLNELQIRCPFRDTGCEEAVALGELDIHKTECTFNPAIERLCDGGCGAAIKARSEQAKEHSCVAYLKGKLINSEERLKFQSAELDGVKAELRMQQHVVQEYQQELASMRSDLRASQNDLYQRDQELKRERADLERVIQAVGCSGTTGWRAADAKLIRKHVASTVPEKLYEQIRDIVVLRLASNNGSLEFYRSQVQLKAGIEGELSEAHTRLHNVTAVKGAGRLDVSVVHMSSETESDLIVFRIKDTSLVIKIY